MSKNNSLATMDSLTGQAKVIKTVLDSLGSEHSKRAYERALKDFLLWHEKGGKQPLSKALVQRYIAELKEQKCSPASINQRLAAIRKLVTEAADNQAIDQQTANVIRSVKGIRQEGRRVGNWLTKEQAQSLLNSISNNSLKSIRDKAILAMLIGCGLRRNEAANLEFSHIQQREGRWVIVDLIGKRGKIRSVPIPNWAKAFINEWSNLSGIKEGKVFRSINKGGRVYGEGMTPQALRDLVVDYAENLGLSVAPHDLRRTFAKLAHKGGAPLEQIQLSLGHASIKTTEVYLGVEQDLNNAPCDFLGLKLEQSNSKEEVLVDTAKKNNNNLIDSSKLELPKIKTTKTSSTLTKIPTAKTTKVKLYLRIENNNSFVRGKKRARENAEKFVLRNYKMKKLNDVEYELTFSYKDDDDLEEQIDLLQK